MENKKIESVEDLVNYWIEINKPEYILECLRERIELLEYEVEGQYLHERIKILEDQHDSLAEQFKLLSEEIKNIKNI